MRINLKIKEMKKIILTLTAVFLIAAGIIGGAYYAAFYKITHKTDTHNLTERIGELSQKFIDEKQADYFVVGIYKGGKIYTQGYGKLDTIQNIPPNDSTVFSSENCVLSQNTLNATIAELKAATESKPQNWQTYNALSWADADDITWKNEEKCRFYHYSGFFADKKTGISILCKNGNPETVNQLAIDMLLLVANVSVK